MLSWCSGLAPARRNQYPSQYQRGYWFGTGSVWFGTGWGTGWDWMGLVEPIQSQERTPMPGGAAGRPKVFNLSSLPGENRNPTTGETTKAGGRVLDPSGGERLPKWGEISRKKLINTQFLLFVYTRCRRRGLAHLRAISSLCTDLGAHPGHTCKYTTA